MAKSGEGFRWLQLQSVSDNLHSPPPALTAELNWSVINMGMFVVTPPAPSPAPTRLFQCNVSPCWEPREWVPAGWEELWEGISLPLTTGAFVSTPRRQPRRSHC